MSDTPEPGDVLLNASGVRVQFGRLRAVNDLSLELRAGDLLGLIGPNGAGKTTLLRALAGLQPLTLGRVEAMGALVIPGAIQALRHIGFTHDEPALYEEMTARDFLRFIGRAYGDYAEDLDERIAFWLEQVWLQEKAGQKIKALSRGMRQRIGIARTLLPNPTVILLDEPAAGLDPAGRVQFRQLLCNLRDQGKAMIVSSHILADMNEYCTHIAIMAKGQIVQFGTVAQVADSGNGDRCRYSVLLARPVPEAAGVLESIAGVTNIQLDRERLTFEYASRREDAAAVLARLVAERVPVASFTPLAPGLEEAYLRTGIRQVD